MSSPLESPYAARLGASLSDDEQRTITLRFDPILIGRSGFLHGGAIAGLLSLASDDAAGLKALCFTSTIQFLRGARTRDLFAVATAVRGTSIATVTTIAWQDDQNRPVANMFRKYRIG